MARRRTVRVVGKLDDCVTVTARRLHGRIPENINVTTDAQREDSGDDVAGELPDHDNP